MSLDKMTELQLNAIMDARRKDLNWNQRTLDMQWMNNRMEDGRTSACLGLIRMQADMEKQYQERTDHAALVNARVAKETALGLQVAKAHREEVVAYQRRHYLRERDPSLRQLAKKLQSAYVCRDVQQQIRDNCSRRMQEKAEELQAIKMTRQAQYHAQEYEEVEAQRKAERQAKYCQELQQQLVYKQMQRQCQYEESLIEKKSLDDILRTIADEDSREIEQKHRLMEKTRKEMETFKQAQDAWRCKQKEQVLLEEKEIERQQQALSNREAAVIAERLRHQKAKDAMTQKICEVIINEQTAKQERENLITQLMEQEHEETMIQNDIAEKTKLERVKKETKEALTKQMQSKIEAERKEREISAAYLKEVKDKIAEDEAKEKEKQQRIRLKNRKHCAELLKQVEDQRRMKAANVRDELLRVQNVKEYERKWLAEIAKERELIVKEHVPNLLGYLQAGVIKKEDLPIVREGANMNPELAKMKIEDLEHVKRPKRFEMKT